jgi:tetratricopeptide (TPR) repeat protein
VIANRSKAYGIFPRGIAILAFLIAVLAGCTKPKDAYQYIQDARNQLQVNEVAKAEILLKEGIQKFPDEDFLKLELIDLYLIVDRAKAEEYLQFVSMHDLKNLERLYSKFSDLFFEEKNFRKAYKYFMLHGEAEAFQFVGKDVTCVNYRVAIEAYRNAAAAGFNLRERDLISNALTQMKIVEQRSNYPPLAHKDKLAEVAAWVK